MTNYNANYPTGVYVIHCEVCETINQLVIINSNNSWYPNIYHDFHTELLVWLSLFRWE